MGNPSNPNGANQFRTDPRQQLCWSYYVKPGSETFANAYASAIRAGYEETTASQITTVDWFLDRMRKLNIVKKAENALEETIGYDPKNDEGKIDPAIARIRLDAAKFAASTLGKDVTDLSYTTRTELSGPQGEDLFKTDEETRAKVDQLLLDAINNRNT